MAAAAAGEHPSKKARREQVASPLPPAQLNAAHTDPDTVAGYAAAFNAGAPFRHLHLHDVFPEGLLARVRDELLGATYLPKRNDLYHFEQTDDLRTARGNATATLRDFVYSAPFRAWMTAITGIATAPTVDISAAKYSDGSYLLCHDDDLSSRRIAYIIYLVPEDFEAADGGSLDLFDTRPDGQPGGVVKRLTPAWNSVAFFDVTPVSFHQVAEVMSDTKGPRLSISGWFYGTPLPRPALPLLAAPAFIRAAPPESEVERGATPSGAHKPTKDKGGSGGATAGGRAAKASNSSSSSGRVSGSAVGAGWATEDVGGVPVALVPAGGWGLGLGLPDGRDDPLTEWISPSYLRRSVLDQVAAQVRACVRALLHDPCRDPPLSLLFCSLYRSVSH
jgi:hypothetical protein